MLQKAPFSSYAEAALISPTLRTPIVKPKARFSNGHQSKGSSGRGRAECWEMRLSAQTDRPSKSQRPPYRNLTARESVERKGLMGRVVIGRGYQRVDEAFKAPTCLLSVHEGHEMADPPLCFFDKGSCFRLMPQTTKRRTSTTLIHNSFWVGETCKTDRAYPKCQAPSS